MDNNYYMNLALNHAEIAYLKNEVPVGAIIVSPEGEIIAEGYNLRESLSNPLCHAEIIAINKAAEKLGKWRLTGCTLYVTLEPCPMCAGAILQSKLSKVVFGAYDEKFGAVGSKFNLFYDHKFNHDVLFTGGVMEKECAALMQKFFQQKR